MACPEVFELGFAAVRCSFKGTPRGYLVTELSTHARDFIPCVPRAAYSLLFLASKTISPTRTNSGEGRCTCVCAGRGYNVCLLCVGHLRLEMIQSGARLFWVEACWHRRDRAGRPFFRAAPRVVFLGVARNTLFFSALPESGIFSKSLTGPDG